MSSLSSSQLGRETVPVEHRLPYRALITTTVPFFAVLLLIEGTGPSLKPLEPRAAHARGQCADRSHASSRPSAVTVLSSSFSCASQLERLFHIADDFPCFSNFPLFFAECSSLITQDDTLFELGRRFHPVGGRSQRAREPREEHVANEVRGILDANCFDRGTEL